MSKNKNPYRKGSAYYDIFAFVKTERIVTREQLLAKFKNTKGPKAGEPATASVTVVLSPRAEGSSRGDCRGNLSAQGHIYFMEPLKKVPGEAQRFRLRFRKTPLEKAVRAPQVEKAAQKSKAPKAKAKGKASKKTAETAEA